MKTTARALLASSIIIASLLASSCDNDFGVFKSIQDEKEQVGTTVFRKTTATGAFKLGDYYYASTAMLNRRSTAAGSTAWEKVSINGLSDYSLRSAVVVGSSMYALITDPSDSKVKLFKSDDAANWTEVAQPSANTTSASYTFNLDALYSAGGHLYAEGHLYIDTGAAIGTNEYTLYYYNGSAFSSVVNFAGNSARIIGVVSDGAAAATYWFASSSSLYSGTSADGSGASSIIGNYTDLSSKEICGLSYAGALYVTTTGGYIYQGGTAAGSYLAALPLTSVVQVPSSSGNIILVGTDTNDVDVDPVGYYEGNFGSLVVGSTNHVVSYTSAIYSTTVSAFPVHAFYYDADLKNLFVCISPGTTSANYYGLYESSYDGSSWSGWDAQ